MKSSVALNYNGLSSEELAKITSPISINRVITNDKEITASEDAFNSFLGTIFHVNCLISSDDWSRD